MVDKTVTALAKASYDRCCKAPDFLQAFYRNFFTACPEAAPAVEAAWRETVAPGVAYMQSKHSTSLRTA